MVGGGVPGGWSWAVVTVVIMRRRRERVFSR